MGWKNWSYKRKGGVIGLVFSILLILLWLTLPQISYYVFYPFMVIPRGIMLLLNALNICDTEFCWFYILPLISLFMPILIGILIGLLVQKIKSRNKGVK